MKKTTLCMSAVALALAACSHADADTGPKPRTADGVIDLIDPAKPQQVNDFGELKLRSRIGDSDLDKEVVGACAAPASEDRFAPLLPIVSMVAGWAIDYVVSAVTAAAQQRLAEYQGTTSRGLRFGPPDNGDFYASTTPPTLALRCVRLRRIIDAVDGKPGSGTLAAEAIVRIETTKARDALLVTPLRLYFDTPLARIGSRSDSTFGVSIGATFDALWQTHSTGEGKAARVWNATVGAQKIVGITGDSRRRAYYYNLPGLAPDPDNRPVPVALVPWSLNRRNGGMGTLTLTLAEVGDPPAILEFVAGTLKDHGSDIGDFLKAAAKKAIDPSASQ